MRVIYLNNRLNCSLTLTKNNEKCAVKAVFSLLVKKTNHFKCISKLPINCLSRAKFICINQICLRHPLAYVWNDFDCVWMQKSFLIAKFFDKKTDLDMFKVLTSIFLHCSLDQGKPKLIMRPQYDLQFLYATSSFCFSAFWNWDMMINLHKTLEQKLEVVWKIEGHTADA